MLHHAHIYMQQPPHRITVELIGTGGTGSHVLRELGRINDALLATGHPGLNVRAWDPDSFTHANVGRQELSASDATVNKAVALVTRSNRYYGTGWTAEPAEYDGTGTSNIIITCLDRPSARARVEKMVRAAIKSKGNGMHDADRPLYWMDFGNARDGGQVVLGTWGTHKQPNVKCQGRLDNILQMFPKLRRMKDPVDMPSCSAAEALQRQGLYVNSLLAQWGCELLWRLLREGTISHHGVVVNVQKVIVNPILISK